MAIYGKKNITDLIGSMIKNDRLSHTFILLGEKGMGRLTLAKEMARMILCQGSGEKPCGVCKSCSMLAVGGHPDLNILSPSGKQENFRADDLRFLISDASLAANEGGYKVYILPEIHKALPAAQNVLLKIIEEPPARVIFIMTATSKENILQTVQSRSVILSLNQMTEADCLAILAERGYSPADSKKAIDKLGANPGRCIAMLEGSGDDADFEAAERVLRGMISADEYVIAKELTYFDGDRQGAVNAIGLLQSAVRDALIIKQGGQSLCSAMKEGAKELSQHVRSRGLEGMYEALTEASRKISSNGNMSLALCDLACKLKSHSLT